MNSLDKRYQILSTLGEGGMGTVYLALDRKLNRKVAIKVLKEAVPEDTEVFRRTVSEGKILSKLNHPSLASVYEMNIGGPTPNIVQEYIKGKTIGNLLSAGIIFTVGQALALLEEQAEVLSFLHEQKVIHRDIKPDNIMIDENGRSILMDFGLAIRPDSTRITQEGAFVGTLAYCPPEIIKGKPATAASDVYQLALVIYQCLTGRHLVGKFESPQQFISMLMNYSWKNRCRKSGFPGPLADIIEKSSSFESLDRPSDGSTLLALIHEQNSFWQSSSSNLKLSGFRKTRKESSPAARTLTKNRLRGNTLRDNTLRDNTLRDNTLRDNTALNTLASNEKKLKRPGPRIGLLLIGFILFITILWAVAGRQDTTASGNQSKGTVLSRARSFVWFPDGFDLFLPSDSGKNLSWAIKKGEQSEYLKGKFTRIAGGWKACVHSSELQKDDTISLSILDGKILIDTRKTVLPQSIFKKPFMADYSYDSISTKWELWGNAPVTLKFKDAPKLKIKKDPVIFEVSRDIHSHVGRLKELGFDDEVRIELSLSTNPALVLARSIGKPGFEILGQLDPENPDEDFTQKIAGARLDVVEARKILYLDAYKEHLYMVTRTGFLYYFIISTETERLLTIKWKRDLLKVPELMSESRGGRGSRNYRIEASSIRATATGVNIYGLAPAGVVYEYSKDGTFESSPLPLPDTYKDGFDPEAEQYVIVEEVSGGVIYCIRQDNWSVAFLTPHKGKPKRILWDQNKDGNLDVIKAFSFGGKDYISVFSGEQQAVLELMEKGTEVRGVAIAQSPLDHNINAGTVMVFDESIARGLMTFDGKLYQVDPEQSQARDKATLLTYNLDTVATQIIGCKNGRFIVPGATLGEKDPLTGRFPAVVKLSEIILTTDEPQIRTFSLKKSLLLENDFNDFRGARMLHKTKAMFAGGSTIFIFDTRTFTVDLTQDFFSAPDRFLVRKDYVLATNTFFGTLFKMPLN